MHGHVRSAETFNPRGFLRTRVRAPIVAFAQHFLDGRFQEIYAAAHLGRSFIQRISKSPNRSFDFDSWGVSEVKPDAGSLFDIPTAFFYQAARSYSSVIEIGAADGRRVIAIKRDRPEISAVAMDIRDEYRALSERDGVSFEFYTIDAMRRMPVGSLVLSSGTLAYYSPAELRDLADVLRGRSMSIAYFEPGPIWRVKKPFRRRLNGGMYYSYADVFKGFRSAIPKGDRWNAFNLRHGFERWDYDFLTPT